MDLQIHGHNLELNVKSREHVEKKLRKLCRHLPGITDVSVELAFDATRSSNDRIVAQMTLHVGKSFLMAHRRAANTKAAVNSVARVLDQQVKRYKSKAYRNARSRLECRQARWRSDSTFRNPRAGGKARRDVDHTGRRIGESFTRQSQ